MFLLLYGFNTSPQKGIKSNQKENIMTAEIINFHTARPIPAAFLMTAEPVSRQDRLKKAERKIQSLLKQGVIVSCRENNNQIIVSIKSRETLLYKGNYDCIKDIMDGFRAIALQGNMFEKIRAEKETRQAPPSPQRCFAY